MTKKKYVITKECDTFENTKICRIKALKDFANVKKGDIGGYVESYDNLSQKDTCWIHDDSIVMDNAQVKEYAHIYNTSIVRGNAIITGYVTVIDKCIIHEHVIIEDHVYISDKCDIYGNATITDNAIITNNSSVCNNAYIGGSARIDNSMVYGKCIIDGNTQILDNSHIHDNAIIHDNSIINHSHIFKNAKISGSSYLENAICVSDISKDLIENLRVQAGLLPNNGIITGIIQLYSDYNMRDQKYLHDDIQCRIGDVLSYPFMGTERISVFNPNNITNITDMLYYAIVEVNINDITEIEYGVILTTKAKIIDIRNIK